MKPFEEILKLCESVCIEFNQDNPKKCDACEITKIKKICKNEAVQLL